MVKPMIAAAAVPVRSPSKMIGELEIARRRVRAREFLMRNAKRRLSDGRVWHMTVAQYNDALAEIDRLSERLPGKHRPVALSGIANIRQLVEAANTKGK